MRRFLRALGLAIMYVCLAALLLGLCVVDAVPDENLTVFLMCLIWMLWGAIVGGVIAAEAEQASYHAGVAQRQSGRLIIAGAQVRALPPAPRVLG